MIAIDWSWDFGATGDRLMEPSAKAQENEPMYARRTAQNAALAVDRKR
jgi:hypothetical protein